MGLWVENLREGCRSDISHLLSPLHQSWVLPQGPLHPVMIAWDGAQVLRQVSKFTTLPLLLGDEVVAKRVVGLPGLFFGFEVFTTPRKC